MENYRKRSIVTFDGTVCEISRVVSTFSGRAGAVSDRVYGALDRSSGVLVPGTIFAAKFSYRILNIGSGK